MASSSEAVERHLDIPSADLDAVSKVAARIQLGDLHLRFINAHLAPLFPAEVQSDWQEHAQLTYDAHLLSNRDHGWDDPLPDDQRGFLVQTLFRAEFDESWIDEDEVEGVATGHVAGQESADDADDLDFTLLAVFNLNYELRDSSGLVRRDLEHFATVNAVFNAWPYWREIAQTTTQRMGISPPLVVPVFTVSPLPTS